MESNLEIKPVLPYVAVMDSNDSADGCASEQYEGEDGAPQQCEAKHVESEKPEQDSETIPSSPASVVCASKDVENKMSVRNSLGNSCLVCGLSFYGSDNQFRHTLDHYRGVVHFCWVCFRTYDNYTDAVDHSGGHLKLPVKDGVGFLCHICGFTESSKHREKILEHLWLHETDNCRSEDNKAFECKAICASLRCLFPSYIEIENESCDAKFSDAESLCRHVKLHVKTEQAVESTVGSDKKKLCKVSTQCKICGELYFRMDLHFRHILSHFEGVKFYCRVCFEVFGCYTLAGDHFKSHKTCTVPSYGVSILCHICGFTESTFECSKVLDHFGQHQKDHHGSADQVGFECGRIYDNLTAFLHCEIEFEMDVEICSDKFTDAESLIMHLKEHIVRNFMSGNTVVYDDVTRPYPGNSVTYTSRGTSCKICGILQPRIDSIFRHVLRHFNGAKFFCCGCFLTFLNYDIALNHCKSQCQFALCGYGVGFVCHICGFSEGANQREEIVHHLYQHKNDIHNIQHRVMYECSRVYSNLRRHMSHTLLFEQDTKKCNARFWSVFSLIRHVKSHIVKESVADASGPTLNMPTEGSSFLVEAQSEKTGLNLGPRRMKAQKTRDTSSATNSEVRFPSSVLPENSQAGIRQEELKHAVKETLSQIKAEYDDHLWPQALKSSSNSIGSCNPQSAVKTELSQQEEIQVVKTEETGQQQAALDVLNASNCAENDDFPMQTEEEMPKKAKKRQRQFKQKREPGQVLNPKNASNQNVGCGVCGAFFTRINFLFQHIINHYEGVQFFCRVCSETFDDYSQALEHFDTHKVLTTRALGVAFLCHMCGFCENSFFKQRIVQHLSLHAVKESTATGGRILKCKHVNSSLRTFFHCEIAFEEGTYACDAEFPDVESLFAHVQQHAVTAKKEKSFDAKAAHNWKKHWFGRIHECVICAAQFPGRIDMLFKHALTHFEGLQFFCQMCFKTFSDYKVALAHHRCHNAPTLAQFNISLLCNRCGMVRNGGDYEENVDHFWQHHYNLIDEDHVSFECKKVISCLNQLKLCQFEFKEGTERCDAKLADAESLLCHVGKHLRPLEVPESQSPNSQADSSTKNLKPTQAVAIKPDCTAPYPKAQQKKPVETVTVNRLADSPSSTDSGTNKLSRIKRETVPFPTWPNPSMKQDIVLVSGDNLKSEGRGQSSASAVDSSKALSKGVIGKIIAVSQNKPKPDNHPQPPAPKRLFLKAESAQDGTSSAGKSAGKSKVKIFTCRVCQKRFVAEHFYRQHLERTGH